MIMTIGKTSAISRPTASAVPVYGAVGLVEALALEVLADERAHDADAGDLLAQDAVDPVDGLLHRAELRQHPRDHQADRDPRARDGHRDQPGQAEVFAQGHEDAADHHDRRRHHDRQGHVGDRLHLGDVVGVARDQRRGAEPGDLLRREVRRPGGRRGAQVAAQPAEVLGAEPGGADRSR